MLQSAGFGFLVLFNGRLYAELKNTLNARKLGASDARQAIASARREGFAARTILFLDQEQGGRMLPEQKAYIYAWVDGVAAGGFRAGIYCSGIVFEESAGVRVVTADDIRQHAESRKIEYWVTNDACPPSPGCAFPRQPPPPSEQWHSLGQGLAVRPVAQAKGCGGGMPGELPCRWKLLSAGNRSRAALARGCRHRHLARSFGRQDSLSFGGAGQFPPPIQETRSKVPGARQNGSVGRRSFGHTQCPPPRPGIALLSPNVHNTSGGAQLPAEVILVAQKGDSFRSPEHPMQVAIKNHWWLQHPRRLGVLRVEKSAQ